MRRLTVSSDSFRLVSAWFDWNASRLRVLCSASIDFDPPQGRRENSGRVLGFDPVDSVAGLLPAVLGYPLRGRNAQTPDPKLRVVLRVHPARRYEKGTDALSQNLRGPDTLEV